MGRNIIVSEETVRDLLEAHASLSAWYYELSAGLRAMNGAVKSPDDATRALFVERLAKDFPEVASVAMTIGVPRMFVPPPPTLAPLGRLDDAETEQSTLIEPALARLRDSGQHNAVRPAAGVSAADAAAKPESASDRPPASAGGSAPAPPPIVNPAEVKYEP
jgi:hypothetical protein